MLALPVLSLAMMSFLRTPGGGLGSLIVACLFAWWGASIAGSKGYQPAVGALVGFFFPCCGILVLLFLPARR